MSLLLTLNKYLPPFSSVSIVDLEHVIVCWNRSKTKPNQTRFLWAAALANTLDQLTFTWSKSTIETLEKGVKYVQR